MDILTKIAFTFGLITVVSYLMVIVFITTKAMLKSGDKQD